jgi:MFS family permease
MQSSWAIGYALAAVVTAIVMPVAGWRGVFLVGLFPALVTLWIRRYVEESPVWSPSRRTGFRELFRPGLATVTVSVTLMNACCLFAWWGFNLWVPAFLSLPREQGGIGLPPAVMSGFIVAMQAGMWLGYVTFGFASDHFGRKRSYITYLVVAAGLLLVYSTVRTPLLLLALGPFVAFFGTGYYTGLGVVTAELYSTGVRATGQAFAYNTGRIASAAAPFTVGSMAETRGFGSAFAVLAAVFLLAAVFWIRIPETKGRRLV